MISLPINPRRLELRSFWLICSAFVATAVVVTGWRFNALLSLAFGVLVVVPICMIVIVREPFVLRLYQGWNNRLVRPVADFATYLVLGICFFIVFVITGALGSRLRLGGNATTMWERRSSLPGQAYNLPSANEGQLSMDAGWIRNYFSWAGRSNNFWAISLLPFLIVLRFISNERQQREESNIYTLF
jgi:hypothetical protein